MGETMVERVARQMCVSVEGEQFWDEMPDSAVHLADRRPRGRGCHRDEYRIQARAAIEAMRVPTEAMIEAIDPMGRDPGLIVHNWYRMIDAALAGSDD